MESKEHIIEEERPNLLTLPDEKLIMAKRKHWFVIVVPIFIILFFGLLFILVSFFVLAIYFSYQTLFLALSLVTLVMMLSAITKTIIDWYFHLYVVTTRRVLELLYTPPFSHKTNGVLLDRVKCTEIDTRRSGIISELADMGDIVLTFDRPINQEEFSFLNIKEPRETAAFLNEILSSGESENPVAQSWYKQKDKERPFRFMEDVLKKK